MQRTITKAHLTGISSLIGATMIYALFGFIAKYIGYSLPLYYQNWTRNLLAALLLVWTYRQWVQIRRQDWPWIVLRTMAGIGAFLLFFISVNVLQVSLTYFIFYGGSTVGGFLLGSVLFHERTTKLRILCLGLALFGLSLVYGVGASVQGPLFVVLSFLSGICVSFWNTAAKKIADYPAIQLVFLDNALAVLFYIIASIIMRERWPLTELSMTQGASLLLGVLFVVTGLLVVRGFRKLDAQLGSLVMLTEIVFVIIFDYLIFRTIPSVIASLGGTLIIIAMIIPELNWPAVYQKLHAYRRKIHR